MMPMPEKKKPTVDLMVAVGKGKPSHSEPDGDENDGLDEEQESPVSPEHASDEDGDEGDGDTMLSKAEEHGASALIEAVHSGDPGAVVSAFKAMYTACHLRSSKDDESY